MINLILGDSEIELTNLESNSVDSIVTDPPAGISFMEKKWDSNKGGSDEWISWMVKIARECLRVLKPGGHALVWAIPRTSHWTGTAWEIAGWQPRDKIYHCFGSGFPKSHNVGLMIDKKYGHSDRGHRVATASRHHPDGTFEPNGEDLPAYAGKTAEGKKWEGWGTGLKPAVEEWWLFRKPLSEKNIAENVLKHGTCGINIDDCRVEVNPNDNNQRKPSISENTSNLFKGTGARPYNNLTTKGRWPSQLIHDGSPEVLEVFPEVPGSAKRKATIPNNPIKFQASKKVNHIGHNDKGSAARFFYTAKASQAERNMGMKNFEEKQYSCDGREKENETPYQRNKSKAQNNHPTIKPLELMKYLVRLITPLEGIILDPFMGSGTTGMAAKEEGFSFIGIEKEKQYHKIAEARIKETGKRRPLFYQAEVEQEIKVEKIRKNRLI